MGRFDLIVPVFCRGVLGRVGARWGVLRTPLPSPPLKAGMDVRMGKLKKG